MITDSNTKQLVKLIQKISASTGANVTSLTDELTLILKSLTEETSKSYKSYLAILTQSGTSIPSEAIVLENDFEDDFTYSREDVGAFFITHPEFESGKKIVFDAFRGNDNQITFGSEIGGFNDMQFFTYGNGVITPGAESDNILNGKVTWIHVKVYED